MGLRSYQWPPLAVSFCPAEGALKTAASCGSHHSYVLPAIDVHDQWGAGGQEILLLAAAQS